MIVFHKQRPVVCVQGLGFVGAAMAVAVASAVDESGDPCFNVVGVDLPTEAGLRTINAINNGMFPGATTDGKLIAATAAASRRGNLRATTAEDIYETASVVVCDVNLDLTGTVANPSVNMATLEKAIRSIGRNMRPEALVVVETTVPPGTCAHVLLPALREELRRRGVDSDRVLLAHSFERVMPGAEYFDSIRNFWRVYAGASPEAADACEAFLTKVVNVQEFPLRRLASTTASELTKVMENSYRAVNIAFIDEWTRFAERIDVDLFEVIEAIRVRPTHSNIRWPGFGVGGYCLTKDPLFAKVAAIELFDVADLRFPFCEQAVSINAGMPVASVARLEKMLGTVAGKNVGLLGISYRQDVGDTRHSPAEVFARAVLEKGGSIVAHDPMVMRWSEMNLDLVYDLPDPALLHAVVFAVPHTAYKALDLPSWLGLSRPAILDANNVLSPEQRHDLTRLGIRVESIGRGTGSHV